MVTNIDAMCYFPIMRDLKNVNVVFFVFCILPYFSLQGDVTELDIQVGGTNLVGVENGDTTTVTLVYNTDTSSLTFSAQLDSGTILSTSSATFNYTGKTIAYPISSSFITDGFGTYLATFTLTPDTGNSNTKQIVIFYEEKIIGFSISGNSYVPLDETVYFNITLTSGSNIETEWFVDTNDTCLFIHPGTPRNLALNFTFTVGGTHNVTAIAANTVSREFDSMIVNAFYKLNGLNITIPEGPYQMNDLVYFKIKLDSMADQPMGTLKVNISYGDGSDATIDLDTHMTTMQVGSGYEVSHSYASQNNFTAVFTVYSEFDTQVFSLNVYIWNSLSVTMDSNRNGSVSEPITFSFVTPPASGFQYYITYGDGNIRENTESDLYITYNFTNWEYAYSAPGEFNVTLVAFNPFYASVFSYVIVIEYPIPDGNISLTPETDEIPIPDGQLTFVLDLTANILPPTGVLCSYDFGDYQEANVSTDFVYGSPVEKSVTYNTSGVKQITITCSNVISSMVKTATVTVRSFTLSDFDLDYENPVNMNMTLNSDQANTLIPGTSDIPVTASFYVTLFACSKFPPDIDVTFDFGDSTSVETNTLTTSLKQHQYTERGTYPIMMTIRDTTDNTETTKTFSVKIGVIDFSVTPMAGEIGTTTFTFNATGMPGTPTYTFESGSNDPMTTVNTDIATIQYQNWGYYTVSVIGTNGTCTEIVYLKEYVKADYNLTGDLDISFSNETVFVPPGRLVMTISTPDNSVTKPYVNCSYITPESLGTYKLWFVSNISSSNPRTHTHLFYTLGNYTLTLKCSNSFSYVSHTAYVHARNPCFTNRGIFDPQYAVVTNPLKFVTSMDQILSSRMGVICNNKTAQFHWKVFTVNDTHTTNILSETSTKGSRVFPRGLYKEGLYYVTLNVSLDGTWIRQFIYLQFEKTAPYAYIYGGSKRCARLTDGVIMLNALDESFDSEGGHGANDNLEFSWNCSRLSTSEFEQMEVLLNDDNSVVTGDCDLQPTGIVGKRDLNISTGSPGYAGTVVVSDGSRMSSFTQFIKIVPGDPPLIVLKCNLNCGPTVVLSVKYSVVTECLDCASTEIPDYTWSLSIFDEASQTYTDVPNFASMTSTGTNGQSLVIQGNQLAADTKYTLKVSATAAGRSGETETQFDLKTNSQPYGGTCSVTPEIGIAASDTFDVKATGWKDDQILKYTYVTEIKRNVSGVIQTEKTELYQGGESTLIDAPLQVGDASTNYTVTLFVRIADSLGDFSTCNKTIQVRPNLEMIPTSPNDTAGIEKLFTSFDSQLSITEGGGNDGAVLRLVSATASMISGGVTEGEDGDGAPTEQEIIDGQVTTITEAEDSPVTAIYKKNVELMTGIIQNIVSSGSSGTETSTMSPADSQQVAQTLKTFVKNPQYLTESAIWNIASTSDTVLKSLNTKVRQKPYPVEDLISIIGAVDGSVVVVDKILQKILPASLKDLDEEISEEIIYNRLYEEEVAKSPTTTIDEASLREKAKLVYSLELQQREYQRQQSASAEQNVPKIVSSIDSAQNVQLSTLEVGEDPAIIEKEGLSISVAKTTANDILNNSVTTLDGVTVEFDNITEVSSSEINITQAVFKKQPFIYGSNSPSVTSKAIQFKISNSSYVPNLKLPNPSQTTATEYQPLMASGQEMVYVRFTAKTDDNAVLVYLKPKNHSPGNSGSLFTLYAQENTYPESGSYVFIKAFGPRDWTGYGYKAFIPERYLNKGTHFLGIKETEAIDYSQFAGARARKKRAAPSITTVAAPTGNSTKTNFTIIVVTTGCRSWNDASKMWESNGCQVLAMSNLNETVCRCPEPSGNTFATTFYVPPNTIDFSSVFSKFDPSNASVYGTVAGLIVVYIIAAVLLRRADKRDVEKWRIRFLCDSDSSDTYFYLVTVYTGLRRGAGTKSRVNFVLAGEDQDSGVRMLSDGVKEGFETGSVRQFLMGTLDPLGDLSYLRIWHDNSGRGNLQSWYLTKIIIDDLQTNDRCVFMCDRWLAVERDDGMVERVLPVCGKENLITFNNLFAQNANFNITENHLWLSLVIRPQRSTFTRVQRLSCLLSLLFLTMITNAMFFRSSDDEVNADQVQLGFIRFSLTTIYISFIGIVITTPPIILVSFIFKKCKPKMCSSNNNKHFEQTLRNKQMAHQEKKTNTWDDFHTTDHLPLPHWTVYIAWTVVVLAVVTSGFFLILYSMEWGKSKSEEWLSTFVFSFLESVVCVDPLKVIVIAVIFALLFKKSNDENSATSIDLDKVRQESCTQHSGATRTYLDFWNEVMKTEQTCTKSLQEHRKKRQQEIRAREAFMQLLMYAIFTFALYSISYIERDHRMYLQKNSLDNYLVSNSKTGFSAVNGTKGFVSWITDVFIPIYYPEDNFNDQTLSTTDKYYISDLANVRLGPGRLRQVRMNRETCPYSKLTWNYPCVGKYYSTEEDTNDHCLNWTPYNASVCGTAAFRQSMITADAWKFIHASDIWGLPLSGEFNTYGGGGYILKFTKDRSTAINMINEVMRYGWIDRGTRAVFLECTLYNPNVNLYAYLIFLTEFTETGGAFTWTYIQSFRPVISLGALGTFAIICYVVFVLHLLVSSFKLGFDLKQIGLCKFIKDPWNTIDSICMLLSYVAIVIFGLRIATSNEAMQMFYDEKLVGDNRYINFFHIVVWDALFNAIIAVLVFVATLRILKILGYNKRFTQIATVVTNAAGEIFGFSIVFGIIFIAYVMLGYLLFGVTLREYRSLFKTWGSLTNALIGKNSLDSMIRAAPHFAQFFYFTYIFCVILTLLTMFAAILNQSISDVKSNISNEPDTFGIADLLTNSLEDITGISFKKKNDDHTSLKKKKFAPVPGKSAAVDAPNILRLVRETFGELGDEQESIQQDYIFKKMRKKEQELLLDRIDMDDERESRLDMLSRIDTPGDITFSFDDYEGGATEHVRPSYI